MKRSATTPKERWAQGVKSGALRSSGGAELRSRNEKDTSSEPTLMSGALGVGIGIGRGVYGRAVEVGKKIFEEMSHSSPSNYSSPTIKPGDCRYPKYNFSYSVQSPYELPSLTISDADVSPASRIGFTVGPDSGFLECYAAFSDRKKQLRQLAKQNPSTLGADELANTELTSEEIKKKAANVRILEKRTKRLGVFQENSKGSIAKNSDRRVFGMTIDTYAFDHIKNERAGFPNADSFYAESYNNAIYFAIADGIGWGLASRRASQSALLGFSTFWNEFNLKKFRSRDIVFLAQACELALELAHFSVHCNTEAKTTFSGGVVFELEHQPVSSAPVERKLSRNRAGLTRSNPQSVQVESDSDSDHDDESISSGARWVFVGISVGDSLIYRYSVKGKCVTELTMSDRTGGVRDAGGSLGGPDPDLRNLTYHCCLVDEGDLLIAVSDGVHDNLDPEVLQVPLEEAGISDPNITGWNQVDDSTKNEKKRKFKENKLCQIIESVSDPKSPELIANAVINFVVETTKSQREGYEKGSLLQRDWAIMPEQERDALNKWVQETLKHPVGKFDHVTCLVSQIGYPT